MIITNISNVVNRYNVVVGSDLSIDISHELIRKLSIINHE